MFPKSRICNICGKAYFSRNPGKCSECIISEELQKTHHLSSYISNLSFCEKSIEQRIEEYVNIIQTGIEVLKSIADGNLFFILKQNAVPVFFIIVAELECEMCSKKYYYLTWRRELGKCTGIPLLSSDIRMIVHALDNAVGYIREDICFNKRIGYAPCPDCGNAPKWMTRSLKHISHRNWLLFECKTPKEKFKIILLSSIGLILAFLFAFATQFNEEIYLIPFFFIIWLFPILMYLKTRSVTNIWKENSKIRIKTEIELEEYISKCKEEREDPFLKWYFRVLKHDISNIGRISPLELSLHAGLGENLVLSLGVLDLKEKPAPENWDTLNRKTGTPWSY